MPETSDGARPEVRESLIERFRPIVVSMGIYLAYLGTAYIGLQIHPVNTFATFIWPPTGIALVVFTMYGYRFVPAIALAAFTVNLALGAGPFVAFFIALGNTFGPLAGAYVLKYFIGFKPPTLRLRDNLGIIGIAISASLATATIGVTSLWLGGNINSAMAGTTWITWLIGDALGILVVAPLLFKWLYWPLLRRSRVDYLELWAVMATVVGVAVLVFWMPQSNFSYYIFIPLTWAALRTGPRGTTLAIFLAASVAISGTLIGYGPFGGEELIYLQAFVGTFSALFLIFAAVIEERRQTLRKSQVHIDELEEALQRIRSEDEAKKEFLAVLAHELRNPLAAVLSSVELLKIQGAKVPDTPKHLQDIDEHVHGMATLLDDLLDISRISNKKFQLKKEVVEIGTAIDRSVRMASRLIRSLGHTLSVTKPDGDIFVEADPVRLEQIVVNLLNNAAKYTEPQGSIELAVRREKSQVVIRVRDSGIGIPQSMLTRIFDPFFQVDRGKPTTEGLGIGLSLTSELVKMHGGSIEARSQGEDRGSEFIVRLPAFVPPPTPHQEKPSSGTAKAEKNPDPSFRILVVDDNRAASDALGKLLTIRGHDVRIAYTAFDAIERAADFDPEIIVLDIGLPDMDGYGTAHVLRQKQFGGVLIALTGYGQESDKKRALEAGFTFYLTKPVGLKEIEAVLNKVSHPQK